MHLQSHDPPTPTRTSDTPTASPSTPPRRPWAAPSLTEAGSLSDVTLLGGSL